MNLHMAITMLAPGKPYKLDNFDIDTLEWIEDDGSPKPSKQEILNLKKQLDDEAESNSYKEKRKTEYPPIEEYIDGVIKGDQNQIDTYIQKCLTVKAKYPKP